MSGTNPLLAPGPASPPMPAPAPPQQAVQQGAPASVPADDVGHLVAGSMRGRDQQMMVQRRDAAGPELEILSRVMNDPNPKPDEVTQYISSLIKAGQIPPQEAIQIIQSMPKDPDALRTWARSMFSAVMHIGVHAHAAFPREVFPSAPQENGTDADSQGPAS